MMGYPHDLGKLHDFQDRLRMAQTLPPGGRHQGRHRLHLVGHRKGGAREHTQNTHR
jgi:hypothetical protein